MFGLLRSRNFKKITSFLILMVVIYIKDMKKVFILEDSPQRIEAFRKLYAGHEVTVTTTAQEAIDVLGRGLDYDLITLDHDLGGQVYCRSDLENSGYRVAKFLSDKETKGAVVIHSWNSIGAGKMLGLLPDAQYSPFEFTKCLI